MQNALEIEFCDQPLLLGDITRRFKALDSAFGVSRFWQQAMFNNKAFKDIGTIFT
jgi:hypothetical protein